MNDAADLGGIALTKEYLTVKPEASGADILVNLLGARDLPTDHRQEATEE
jgi:hypothetical protein